MEPLTTVVNTKDWLEAIRGMTILAYVEPYASMPEGGRPFTKEDFETPLRKATRLEDPKPVKEKVET